MGRFVANVWITGTLPSRQEVQIVIEQWRQEYKHRRPHSSLGYLPPVAFAEKTRLSLELRLSLGEITIFYLRLS
jgi:transposase InsO family protein